MELNSDGKQDTKLKKNDKKCVTSNKRRSHSVGTINLSQADINKIIGVDLKNSKQLKTYLDAPKQKTAENNSNPISKKDNQDSGSNQTISDFRESFSKESFGTYDIDLTNDSYFKPRNSILRTPPYIATQNERQDKTNSDENEVIEEEFPSLNSQKRIRSNSSPTIIGNRSKIKKPNLEATLNNKEDIESNKSCVSNTETILNEILDALDRIHKHIEIIPQNEAKNTISDLFTVHRHVTNLAFKIGETEKKNSDLKNKISELSHDKRTTHNSHVYVPQLQLSPVNKKTPYSDVAKYVPAGNNPTSSAKVAEWKTPPPQNTKHETIVRLKENKDSRKVMQEIKENLKSTNTQGHFKRIKPLDSGSVIVECQDASQQKKLKETLENANKNMEVKNIFNLDPMLMVTGILKGHTPETFLKDFMADNPDILDTFGENVENQFKYVTKRTCRNNTKENWIFQTPPALFKWLIRNNNLVFDLCPAYVQEYTNVAICFKCSLFGHVAKFCKANDCCHKCGGAHNGTQCTATDLECPNCKRSNLVQRNHSARNPSCPIYMQRIRRLQQQTNYLTSDFCLAEK